MTKLILDIPQRIPTQLVQPGALIGTHTEETLTACAALSGSPMLDGLAELARLELARRLTL